MVKLERLVFGIYPKSEHLRIRIGRWQRGEVSSREIMEIIGSESSEFISMIRNEGIDHYTGPLFNWFDIFRPFFTILDGVHPGPLTRYLETNTFYRIPEISGRISLKAPIDAEMESVEGLPLPLFNSGSNCIFLPGIKSFYDMSSRGSKSEKEFYREMLEVYGLIMAGSGGKKLFIFETTEPGNFQYSSYEDISPSENIILYLNSAVSADNLASLSGRMFSVVADGSSSSADLSRHHSRMAGLKVVDAHSTKLESHEEIMGIVEDFGSDALLTTNDYMDFLPRKIADLKIRALGKVSK